MVSPSEVVQFTPEELPMLNLQIFRRPSITGQNNWCSLYTYNSCGDNCFNFEQWLRNYCLEKLDWHERVWYSSFMMISSLFEVEYRLEWNCWSWCKDGWIIYPVFGRLHHIQSVLAGSKWWKGEAERLYQAVVVLKEQNMQWDKVQVTIDNLITYKITEIFRKELKKNVNFLNVRYNQCQQQSSYLLSNQWIRYGDDM